QERVENGQRCKSRERECLRSRMVEPKGRLHEAPVLEHQEQDDCQAGESELGRKAQRAVDEEIGTLSAVRHLPAEVRSRARAEEGVRIEDVSGGAGLCL